MNKHKYICEIAEVVMSKSSCFKRKVGAVFINEDYEILATGFNESPRGFGHCDAEFVKPFNIDSIKGTCGNPCTRTIHAEQNAIVQAAKRGTALENSILYCTYLPCITCARLLVNLKIQSVYYKHENQDGGFSILILGGIILYKWEEVK